MAQTAQQPKHADSRAVVRGLLSALSPIGPPAPILSQDIESLARLVNSVFTALDDDILTAEEANAVIDFVASRFAARRVDEAMTYVFKPRQGAWFQIHFEDGK